jgi:hypothetical protein
MTSLEGTGGYAERAIADVERLVDLPRHLGTPEALALLADGRTAVLLARSAAIQASQTVLVEAAAGGVGSLLVQLAHLAGARVIAAAGGRRKLAVARELGAEEVVDYSQAHWEEQIEDGVDVVFDGVGGEIGAAAFTLARPGGRFCAFGMASGGFADIDEAAASARRIMLVRGLRPTADELRSALSEALDLATSGRLRGVIGQLARSTATVALGPPRPAPHQRRPRPRRHTCVTLPESAASGAGNCLTSGHPGETTSAAHYPTPRGTGGQSSATTQLARRPMGASAPARGWAKPQAFACLPATLTRRGRLPPKACSLPADRSSSGSAALCLVNLSD